MNFESRTKRLESGYVAITSVIIISVLLITITAALSTVNFHSRFNILESEYKQRSLARAESCLDVAMYKIAQNSNYTQNTVSSEPIGSDTCKIISVTGANPKTIKIQGEFQNSFTNLIAVVNPATLNLVSWEEVAN